MALTSVDLHRQVHDLRSSLALVRIYLFDIHAAHRANRCAPSRIQRVHVSFDTFRAKRVLAIHVRIAHIFVAYGAFFGAGETEVDAVFHGVGARGSGSGASLREVQTAETM